MRIEMGREIEVWETGSVGHKEAFTVSVAEPRLLLCKWAKSWPGTMKKIHASICVLMCCLALCLEPC